MGKISLVEKKNKDVFAAVSWFNNIHHYEFRLSSLKFPRLSFLFVCAQQCAQPKKRNKDVFAATSGFNNIHHHEFRTFLLNIPSFKLFLETLCPTERVGKAFTEPAATTGTSTRRRTPLGTSGAPKSTESSVSTLLRRPSVGHRILGIEADKLLKKSCGQTAF